MKETIEAIKTTLGKIKGISDLAAGLSDDADIIHGVGLDSLQMLRFMLELEERLKVTIDFDRLEYSYFNSVRTLAEFMDGMPHRQSPTGAK